MRLIVRRVKPSVALFVSYHAFQQTVSCWSGRHAEIENAIGLTVGLNHLPLGPLRRERGVARGASTSWSGWGSARES